MALYKCFIIIIIIIIISKAEIGDTLSIYLHALVLPV